MYGESHQAIRDLNPAPFSSLDQIDGLRPDTGDLLKCVESPASPHRGPDDSGRSFCAILSPMLVEIGLGDRRLAILDLSALAHQPMHDAETGNWIVYNGDGR
jgi:hypothetical protein